ncbi:uncharacterized protein LOC116611743 [Nematostella vectensis]|uniref:uncharacterized protein LOC116611743 n=1 Tax=Nematostella vectensis TaxID=45351 RepID=UPI0020775904|nr:uncharacterized protein LOC116611743 [Nematostella vectensis]
MFHVDLLEEDECSSEFRFYKRDIPAISAKESPLDNCFGFIDGNVVRPICRPNQHQEIVYNGLKRVHSIKFQSVAPEWHDGEHVWTNREGKRHDAFMLRESGLPHDLALHAFSRPPAPHPLCLYGDPAYPLRIHLQGPFGNTVHPLKPQMKENILRLKYFYVTIIKISIR